MTSIILLLTLSLFTYAQSSGGGSETVSPLYYGLPASSIISIMVSETVEGSVQGSFQVSEEVVFGALAFSAETGKNVFITSFHVVEDVIQFTIETSTGVAQASPNVIQFVLMAPVSIFETAVSASGDGSSMMDQISSGKPIPVQVEPFKVGHEQKQAGWNLTTKDLASYAQKTNIKNPSSKVTPFTMVVLNDLGRQLYSP